MASDSNELQQFHEFIGQQLASGAEPLTPEECLDAWRAEHPTPDELAASVAAIEEAWEQAKRGEGIPLEDYIRQFRAENGLDSL